MAKPEWGAKRHCAACGVRFYDLNRDPIACPECGAVFTPEVIVRGKRVRVAPRADAAKAVVVDLELEDDVEDAADDDEDDDAVVLDEDDDDDDAVVVAPAADEVEEDVVEADDDVLLEADDEDADDDLDDLVEKDDDDPLSR